MLFISLLALLTAVLMLLFTIWWRAVSFRIRPIYAMMPVTIYTSIVVADVYGGFLPYIPDSETYKTVGQAGVQSWKSGNFGLAPYHDTSVQIYGTFLSVVYYTFGENNLIPTLFNTGFWGLTSLYWAKIGETVLGVRNKNIIILLMVSVPSAMIYHTTLVRAGMSIFVVSVVCWHITRWFAHRRQLDIIGIIVGTILVYLLRPELVPVLLLATIITLITPTILYITKDNSTSSIVSILSSVGVFILFVLTDLGARFTNPFQIDLIDAKRASEVQHLTFVYLEGMEYNTWIDILNSIPIRLFYILYTPFPWRFPSHKLILATADSIYMILLTILLLYSIKFMFGSYKEKIDWQSLLFLLSFAIITLVGYSLVVSAATTAPRRRLYAVPIIAIIASLPIDYVSKYIRIVY